MMLARFFRFDQLKTNYRRELLGGLTTFVTMAYIIVVNPAILSVAGIPLRPSIMATILVAVAGTLIMGLYARRPIAVAPYMGENAFVAFTVVALLGATWQQALGGVFLAGVLFVILTVVGVRGWLAESLPRSLRFGFASAIGLFLAFIGLYQMGVVRSFVAGLPAAAVPTAAPGILGNPDVPIKIGDFHEPTVLLAIFCFALIVVLMVRKVPGAILIGMAVTATIGGITGHASLPEGVVAAPLVGEYSLAPIVLKLDIVGALTWSFAPILMTIFLMDFLDTIGTLIGVGAAGDMLDENGQFPEIEKPMMADASASVLAALLGTTTAGAFIESATGAKEGARSGFAAVVIAAAFFACLFFVPLVEPLATMKYVWGPPLVVVGILMMGQIAKIDFDDLTECVPAVVTVLMVIFTYNIGNGLTAGLIAYPAMKIAAGRFREVNSGTWALAGFSLVYYLFGVVH